MASRRPLPRDCRRSRRPRISPGACRSNLKVASEIGKGTIAAPVLARADELTSARKHKTIPVVDDDNLVRKSVIAQMNSLGYSTIEASGPLEALKIIASPEPFDLLFTDVVMA